MSLEDIKTLVETLRTAGVTHFKQGDLELSFGPPPSPLYADADVDPEKKEAIPHVIEELKSVLGIDDNDLVDRLFPEPQAPDLTEKETSV
jgi:hypothetical protein